MSGRFRRGYSPGTAAPASSVPSIAWRHAGIVQRVSRRMRNAGKVVQGATLYVFAEITEVEKTMVRKVGQLAKATARAVRPVLWPRRPSESQSAPVPSENLIF